MIKMRQCSACNKPIADKYLFQIDKDDRFFHWSCLRCRQCGNILTNFCHIKNGNILCKEDYLKFHGAGNSYSCQGCYQVIDNVKDWVIKIPSPSQSNNHNKSPSNNINPSNPSNATSYTLYHAKCIQCFYCKRTLNPGDKYVLNKMNQTLVCTSSPCISHYTSNCSSAVPSPYAPSMSPSPLQQPASTHHQQTKMSVPSVRGRRGRGGGMYKKF
ncbi:LIM domain transcription factor LMO4-like isoform X3 [Panonychus citri]|uniref:LIM domain transcription factor LMO4-like isoform X3 n=2 Tax=Panonychus citri TaxID=50023 RepID=UPI002307570F|nr:LIM domain transcription factor LMO4-like isoform X3 [Panonychus citri]